MKSVLIAPSKYVQGRGVLQEIGTYVAALGTKPLVLWDSCVKDIVGGTVLDSLQRAGLAVIDVQFEGESTREEAARVAQLIKDGGADVCIGIGGGKTLDTAKAAATEADIAKVTVPTIASTDTPCSSATVWYDDDGNCIGWDCWPKNPDLVLVDSQVIANGPVRAFVAGMGDAMSTWVEAEAVTIGTGWTKGRYMAKDYVGLNFAKVIVGDAHSLGCLRAEVLNHHIRVLYQLI